jgi:hypothetical protein
MSLLFFLFQKIPCTSLFDSFVAFIYFHDNSLQGRGCEVQLLSGDADAAAGDVDEENANRKTVSEILSLNPHDSNVIPAPSV